MDEAKVGLKPRLVRYFATMLPSTRMIVTPWLSRFVLTVIVSKMRPMFALAELMVIGISQAPATRADLRAGPAEMMFECVSTPVTWNPAGLNAFNQSVRTSCLHQFAKVDVDGITLDLRLNVADSTSFVLVLRVVCCTAWSW